MNVRFKDKYLKFHQQSLYSELINRTSFLTEFYGNKYIPIDARLYCIEHHIESSVTCQRSGCDNLVGWNRKCHEFRKYCSCKCQALSEEMKLKRYETNLRIYGHKHFSQSNEFKKQIQEIWFNRTKEDIDEITKKCESTCMERMGVKHPAQLKSIQEKMKSTMLEHYGVEHALQSDEIKSKFKNTCVDRFGVEYPIQRDDIKERMKITWTERNGGFGFESDVVKNSILEKYNVDNASKLDWVKDKKRNTCIKHYGVDNYAKTRECHKLMHKSYTNPKYPDMTFGSSWEFLVYEFLLEKHIEFQYQPSISFEYEYDGKVHTYHPDFMVGDKIFEVKGDNFFRINESTGKEEMYLPWKGKLSDDEYKYMCCLYEAKHQCMLSHNVIILRESDIKNLNIDSFSV